jgi:hypothetical protein
VGIELAEIPRRDRLKPVARLQALSLGHALDLSSPGTGAVHSVFPRAVNLEVRGDLWTLLSAQRADLPFGIRVAAEGFDTLGLRCGDRVSVRSGFVGVGRASGALAIDCHAAPRWIPARQGECAHGLANRLAFVAAQAQHRAWPGSARMARAVTSALHDPTALAAALPEVVGCGPGSTPAGDDVLVGIFALLTSPHSGAAGATAACALQRALHPLLPTTTDISAHLLRQAARGLLARPVHELMSALNGSPAAAPLGYAVLAVLDMGATSGADLCVGLLAAARAFLPIHDENTMAA